ncbi:hypothetical protein [Peribacillus glennii]|uniref:hypothetical protein n=1 Tax=Peribacillus glennii TaxID=2303991 RepID=UPI001314981B|nr:hypothetical protein [Peribacillus glennii]
MGKDEKFLEETQRNQQATGHEKGNNRGQSHGTPDPRGRYGQQIDSDITEYE